jgi:glycogen(starch) synthase
MSIRIAFISYEYPPDTSGGGIGTYIFNVVRLLLVKGYRVSIFCGTKESSYQIIKNNFSVYRVKADTKEDFRVEVVNIFSKVHQQNEFQILESPDYGADGYLIKQLYPSIPYIVKLHTPTYLINYFNNYFYQYGRHKNIFHKLNKLFITKIQRNLDGDDIEYRNVKVANFIISPSRALAIRVSKDWRLKHSSIKILPNPYQNNIISLDQNSNFIGHRVLFIGKLSIIKGLIEFPIIIEKVLEQFPNVKFTFLGEDCFSHIEGLSMKDYILRVCNKHLSNIEFTGKLDYNETLNYLSKADILICNSLWENFPNIILESLHSGKVIIATKVGGIPEIIQNGKNGYLVPPKSAKKVAAKIIYCYKNPHIMMKIQNNAKQSGRGYEYKNQLGHKIDLFYQSILN